MSVFKLFGSGCTRPCCSCHIACHTSLVQSSSQKKMARLPPLSPTVYCRGERAQLTRNWKTWEAALKNLTIEPYPRSAGGWRNRFSPSRWDGHSQYFSRNQLKCGLDRFNEKMPTKLRGDEFETPTVHSEHHQGKDYGAKISVQFTKTMERKISTPETIMQAKNSFAACQGNSAKKYP